ncbi:MAG: DUF167 domain-containing protein [Deltaproteobacteria bacterium]|nr:DUF167 domain-containing protein [Deltaproteobacteria bacterium]
MLIKFHVQPGARKNEITGKYGDAIKVKLITPPVEGRANEALIELLAEKLGIAKSKIILVRGAASRQKLLSIDAPETLILSLFKSDSRQD